MNEAEMIDTLPLLRLLGNFPTQTLSRGTVIANGITERVITEARDLNQIVINITGLTRDGEQSSLASIVLTDVGEAVLDNTD